LIKNLDPVSYQKTLKRAACAIGNSSSFIRDSTFSGTPVVLVGDRQVGREHGENLISCPPNTADIVAAIRQQVASGRYPPSMLYGDGNASQKIIQELKAFQPNPQKRLHYLFANDNTHY
jgi:UDP-N-acetylglucosamine 2-epimerase